MKKFKFTSSNIQLAALHIVFWTMLLLPSILFRYNGPSNNFSENFLYRMLIGNIILGIIFYLNAYFYYPYVFKKKGLLLYIIVVILTLVAAYYISKYVDTNVFPSKKKWGKPFFFNFISYLFILGISCSYRIIVDHMSLRKINKEKETENLKTELSFLRSQVSPHFMFNVLNNLVSLARKKSDKMEPALLQLSSLLRYMLYEGNHGKINLNQELSYLQGYIDLQKLRFGDDVEITFTIVGDPNEFELEPMILIPFVENAFKHGMGTISKPSIKISMLIENKTLIFTVENDIAPEGESKDKSSGIGLSNTKRRLALLYKDYHELILSKYDGQFKVQLKLQMHD